MNWLGLTVCNRFDHSVLDKPIDHTLQPHFLKYLLNDSLSLPWYKLIASNATPPKNTPRVSCCSCHSPMHHSLGRLKDDHENTF